MKVARIASVPRAIVGYRKLFEGLQRSGAQITIMCSEDEDFPVIRNYRVANIIPIPIAREISPIKDIAAVLKLFRSLIHERFDIVHSMTPKGGLVTAIAAFAARVPIRFHTFTGQRWETLTGFKRLLLIYCDWLIAKLSTHCFADSPSQASYLVKTGIVDEKRISCIHKGSFGGVDFEKFNVETCKRDNRGLRATLGIAGDALVISFVGRLVKDKGIDELVDAFTDLAAVHSNLILLLIGPIEVLGNKISERSLSTIKASDRIIEVGNVTNPEAYLSISDIFCLPSYREGFGTVILEAAAMKLPTVGTRIVGIVDAIEDQKTGILVAPQSVDSLRQGLHQLIADKNLRRVLGEAAYERAISSFATDVLVEKTIEEYQRALNKYRRFAQS